jgi:DNA-binding NarL/FixJ family response regulator
MKPLSVVIANGNSHNAEFLLRSLNNHFRVVSVARDLEDLRHAIPRHKAEVAIVDLELAKFEDVQQLAREFADTVIVCTHRLADDGMWTNALAAGAVDCCSSSDVRSIVLAASQTKPVAHTHAA